MSVYMLEEDERSDIDDLFKNVDQLVIAEKLKVKLDDYVDGVMDEVTNYMKDEYVLRFEEIALSQANKIVKHILQGNNLDSFGLVMRKDLHGKDWVYDPDKIRAKIVEDYAEQIMTAEMFELKKENERLKKDIQYYRERERY